MERGKSIVIEGNDGTGKSTQVDLLADYLRQQKGITSYVAHEPAGTPMADAIRQIIKNGDLDRHPTTNLLLFTAARHEIHQRETQQLSLGNWVLKARDWSSTVAYQGSGEGLDPDFIEKVTAMFTDEAYMQPDHKVILTLNDAARRGRIENRGELEQSDTFEKRGQDFQDLVNSAYLDIARKHNYPVLDANQTVDEIQLQIRQIIGLS